MIEEAYEFLARGGPLMIPIALCSLVALAIFLERIWALQRNRVLPPHFLSVLEPYIRERKWTEVRRLCESSVSSIATVVQGGLRHVDEDRASVRESMEEAGRRVLSQLERYLGMLSAMATVAPLLGLLGTVTGMIEVFQRVEDTIRATGDVQAGVLASGIWEALMTTAAGLCVAIPAFIAAAYLHGRVDGLLGELEEHADVVADFMAGPRSKAAAAGATGSMGDEVVEGP